MSSLPAIRRRPPSMPLLLMPLLRSALLTPPLLLSPLRQPSFTAAYINKPSSASSASAFVVSQPSSSATAFVVSSSSSSPPSSSRLGPQRRSLYRPFHQLPVGRRKSSCDTLPLASSSSSTTTIDAEEATKSTSVAAEDDAGAAEDAVEAFLNAVSASLREETFVSFALHGSKPPKKTKGKKKNLQKNSAAADDEEDEWRGRIKLIKGRPIMLKDKTQKKRRGRRDRAAAAEKEVEKKALFVQATVKYHSATDVARNWRVVSNDRSSATAVAGQRSEEDEVLHNLRVLLMGINSDGSAKSDSFASEWGDAAILTDDAATAAAAAAAAPKEDGWSPFGIRRAVLETTVGSYELELPPPPSLLSTSKKRGKAPRCRFIPSGDGKKGGEEKSGKKVQYLEHDRKKNVPLLPSEPFLQRLGITAATTNGDVQPRNGDAAKKLRQCQKFVEIAGTLIDRCCQDRMSIASSTASDSDGDAGGGAVGRIETIDMGCGRGYLTFSLHKHLSDRYGNGADHGSDDGGTVQVLTRGIDRRPKLIDEINGIAADLGPPFVDALTFDVGTIGDTAMANSGGTFSFGATQANGIVDDSKSDTLRVLIALHACDTATDDALHYGLTSDADVLLTAPCCQHEVRPQLNALASHIASSDRNHPMADMWRYNIYRERAAETVTDALRALLLEYAGYDVKVFEFVGGEHTAKNVMIAATKKSTQQPRSRRREKEPLDEEEKERLRQRIRSLAAWHGVQRQRLSTLLGVSLLDSDDDDDEGVIDAAEDTGRSEAMRRARPGRMPPHVAVGPGQNKS